MIINKPHDAIKQLNHEIWRKEYNVEPNQSDENKQNDSDKMKTIDICVDIITVDKINDHENLNNTVQRILTNKKLSRPSWFTPWQGLSNIHLIFHNFVYY